MYNVLKMGKKVFTVSVVVATIAWSIGLAALLMPLAASAADLSSGDLIKASMQAVYYYGADGKRYVFPNEKTYNTWYSDFSGVKTITDAELAAIQIGGNATYRPGVKMVKITTDPKVYAVGMGGALRWVTSEAVATGVYGGNWNQMIDDVSDAFFTNYTIGADVNNAADFDKVAATNGSPSINIDKALSGAAETGGGALTIAAGAANPASATLVADTTLNSGQQRALVMQVTFTAGSKAASVTSLKFKRSGISKDADVDSIYLMEGSNVLREVTSVNDSVATFSMASDPLIVTANSSRTLDVVLNLNQDASSGSTMSWSLASADVASDATSVSGSVSGATMSVAVVTDLAQMEVGNTNIAPASVDPGMLNKEMWRVSFAAQSNDMLLTYVKFTNLGSSNDADIQNVKLYDGATQLNGTVSQPSAKEIVFDMTTMDGGGYEIKAGQVRQFTLNGDIVAGTDRTYEWSIQKQYDVRARDLEYNVWAFVDDYDATDDNAFGVVNQDSPNTGDHTTINVGSLTVGLASDSPNTTTINDGSGVTLAKYAFKANGEDVKVKTMIMECNSNDQLLALDNFLIKFDGVQVGATDATILCDGGTDTTTFTLGNSMILKVGQTHYMEVIGDLTDSTVIVGDTVVVSIDSGTAEGKTSLTNLDTSISAVSGHNLTVKGAELSVFKNTSYTDRSSAQPTGVTNAQGVKVASFIVVGGDAEAANISQVILRDDTTYFMGNNFQNLVLKDINGNQVGTTISSLNTSASTYTFTPATAIGIAKGEQQVYDVYADVKSSVTNSGAARAMLEVDQVLATGVSTGSSANYGSSTVDDATEIALQTVYLALHGNLSVDESADTPVAQQLVLGSTGASLAKFKLSADAVENITVTQFTVAQDMSTGFASSASGATDGASAYYATARAATGSIKNLKLYNGTTLLGSVTAFDSTSNSQSAIATFSGFTLTVPKNQNVILEVKGDLTSFSDGGVPSSSHRLFVPGTDVKPSTSATDNPVVAVGEGSGISMSSAALDLLGGTQTTADNDVPGNYMDLVRAKLTLAHAADSPSGSTTPSTAQTVAKFVATNSANVGSYSVHVYSMNFDVASTGASISGVSPTFTIYKDSIGTANQLDTTEYLQHGVDFGSTKDILDSDFTDLEISSGSSRTIIITLETNIANFDANDSLSVGIAANDVMWNDNSGDRSYDYYNIDTLPISGKTLVY
ncbi:hypothetical protein L6259_03505 [Candidatus Parcubacteria bacterium]|nr:hypothetical protein [Candidatus Parcubacteria bacterium]